MNPPVLARLLVRAALRSGAVAGVLLALTVVAGTGTGLVGILLVLVGGLVAGVALVNPRSSNSAGFESVGLVGGLENAVPVPSFEGLDPLSGPDPPASAPVRRFLFGLGLFVVGVVMVVLAG